MMMVSGASILAAGTSSQRQMIDDSGTCSQELVADETCFQWLTAEGASSQWLVLT